MSLGISLAPEESECKLCEKVAGLEGVEILRDNLLGVGYGDTQEEADANHDGNLRKFLNRAREVTLRVNSKKMVLKRPQVKFVGHIIGKEGVNSDPDKVKAVKEMRKPTSKKEVFSLLGFINYMARFLPKRSVVIQLLRDLTLAKAQFVWSE